MEEPVKKKKPLIFGTGLSSGKDYETLKKCCSTAIDSGICSFDTAPSYKTEGVLGQVLNDIIKEKQITREYLHIQTKIDPIQMYEGHIEKHVEGVLRSMQLDYFDCLLIHWPVYKYLRRTWEALVEIKYKGVAKSIGICNLRESHLQELKGIEIVPDVLQIERHPLNIFEAERRFCEVNGIALQDYSPLCKMHPLLKESKELAKIADLHDCGIGEVILCWHIQTGAIPIFTSTKPSRIEGYANLEKIVLTESELATVSALNINHKLYLESLICPGF